MSESAPIPDYHAKPPPHSLLGHYRAFPLYIRIVIGLVIGIVIGVTWGEGAVRLKFVSQIILRFLGALAPALILVAVIDAILNAQIRGGQAARMIRLLILNTLVAILIGLLVANVVRPGKHEHLAPTTAPREAPQTGAIAHQLMDTLPKSVLEPLVTNNVIGIVFLSVAFGIALRRLSNDHDMTVVNQVIQLGYKAIVIILHWIIDLVPLAVLCTVAAEVGHSGFAIFRSLAWFIGAVLFALALQATWYLTRIRLGSWVRPLYLIKGMRDALVMAFSTSSSTATMPVTYAALRERVGLREDSASMGALVGSNFNNDGTALYEAMAALFISQMIGQDLSVWQQVIVVFMSVIAAVGAAGIPEAGLVTMTLVFNAVDLDPKYVFLLLPVDWFLDRCRTVINVMGDVNVACLLEGKEKSEAVIQKSGAEEPVAELTA
jgi:DAACS family dicarboxylate/amino acid:cation (Na+ or H+) symporter